ncbi:Oxidoreductase AflY [Colletotrichum sidae]|uniref:Oxidoreductase AflY n=1 Tax=Colletotrichum sidae TaxID=1347389 RepID=A0A4R8TCV2_9PEZI|nr:Oxidoreductase AflY [Colletotrichum sidae]
MEHASKFLITKHNTGLWNVEQSEEAAEKVTELLQLDLKNHHVFLNDDGFHNHTMLTRRKLPQHLLALYGTGASVANIQKAYDQRHPLTRPSKPRHCNVLFELERDWNNARNYLGKDEYYPDFLSYFQRTVDARGYAWTVNEFLLKQDAAADDLLVRLHAGALHPLTQLTYALEWRQPAMVAEAMAQTCARLEDGDKTADGVLARAKEPMLALLGRIRVTPEQLEEKTAEMFHAIVYVASGAAIRPPHHVKYDYFLMHHVNASPFYPTANRQAWIPDAAKARLLEWKMRMDVVQYAARGCPSFSLDDILRYEAEIRLEGSPRDMSKVLHDFGDDGHAIEQARATALCHELTRSYADRPWAVLRGDETWRTVQHMVVDAVQGPGRLYVRGAGMEEVWKDVPLQWKFGDEFLRASMFGQ